MYLSRIMILQLVNDMSKYIQYLLLANLFILSGIILIFTKQSALFYLYHQLIEHSG